MTIELPPTHWWPISGGSDEGETGTIFAYGRREQNPEHLRQNHPDQPVILIADDEVMIQNIVRVTLEQEGYFVLTAENGEAALVMSRQYPGRIHLLLTDVGMPNMSGV